MYTTQFTVKGRGRFPADMLRYDSCYPSTGEDVSWMDMGGEREQGERELALTTHHKHKNIHNLTPDRWASFGWVVTEIYPAKKVG